MEEKSNVVLCDCGRSVNKKSLVTHKRTGIHRQLLKEKGLTPSETQIITPVYLPDGFWEASVDKPISLISLLKRHVIAEENVDPDGKIEIEGSNTHLNFIHKLCTDFTFKGRLVRDVDIDDTPKCKRINVYLHSYKDWHLVGYIPPKYNNEDFILRDGKCTITKNVTKDRSTNYIVTYHPV